jgi:hypothetical protein
MKKQVKLSYLLLAIPFLFMSCQKNELSVYPETEVAPGLKSTIQYCGTTLVANLVDFNQTITAGTLTVGNDDAKLYVTYDLPGEWLILNATLYAGTAADVPGTLYPDGSGNFAQWLFPYYYYPWTPIPTHTFEIDLNLLENCFVVIAYAHAENSMTGERKFVFAKSTMKTDGYYLEYCKQSCTPPPPPLGTCETAYAYSELYGNCFLSIPGLNSTNWGWSNGQIGAGNYVWPLYAKAGQCIIGNGILVGTLEVNYTPPTATVTYAVFNGYLFNETHLYVGTQILPKKNNKYTTAPGQFPYKHENLNGVTSDTYTVNGLSGNIYVVAHSVVCDE